MHAMQSAWLAHRNLISNFLLCLAAAFAADESLIEQRQQQQQLLSFLSSSRRLRLQDDSNERVVGVASRRACVKSSAADHVVTPDTKSRFLLPMPMPKATPTDEQG